jgi:hypothetical protein
MGGSDAANAGAVTTMHRTNRKRSALDTMRGVRMQKFIVSSLETLEGFV